MAPKERLEDIIERLGEPLANELGYELVAVEYRKEGPNWILRCFIDSPKGIGLNECQHFSEAFGELLDQADPIPGSYLLEVSSPGVERSLKKDNDFLRFAGEKIELTLHKSINGKKVYQGELLGLLTAETGKIIQLKINDTVVEIPRNEIARAHIVVDIFGSKGGKKRK